MWTKLYKFKWNIPAHHYSLWQSNNSGDESNVSDTSSSSSSLCEIEDGKKDQNGNVVVDNESDENEDTEEDGKLRIGLGEALKQVRKRK